MLSMNDIDAIEGNEEVSEQDYYAAIQRAINGGMWGLQGSYGRTMMEAIKAGRGIKAWAHGRTPDEARQNCISREASPPSWIVKECA
jgi:hypothetical protein